MEHTQGNALGRLTAWIMRSGAARCEIRPHLRGRSLTRLLMDLHNMLNFGRRLNLVSPGSLRNFWGGASIETQIASLLV